MEVNSFKTLLSGFGIFLLSLGIAHAQSKPAELTINTKKDLDAGRAKIDSLDNQLIKVLGEREKIVKAIGVYKAKNHIAPLQEGRFKQVVRKTIAAGNKVGLSPEFIMELLNAIHKESLRIENAVKPDNPK
jgi:chorismate mutase